MRNRKRLAGLITLALMATAPLLGSIDLSNDLPVAGESVRITTSEPVDSLRIVFRPNSSLSRTVWIVNDPAGTAFEWTPPDPGLVQLSYLPESGGVAVTRNVSVRFQGLSVTGLIVMFLAGTILFGSVAIAFRTLFRDESEDGTPDFVPEELPDT